MRCSGIFVQQLSLLAQQCGLRTISRRSADCGLVRTKGQINEIARKGSTFQIERRSMRSSMLGQKRTGRSEAVVKGKVILVTRLLLFGMTEIIQGCGAEEGVPAGS